MQKPGDPGRALLTESARETIEGDLLLGIENEVPLNFVPRAPDVEVNGQIVSVADGASIVLNKTGTIQILQAGDFAVEARDQWHMGETLEGTEVQLYVIDQAPPGEANMIRKEP